MKTRFTFRRLRCVAASFVACAVLGAGAVASAQQTYAIKLHINKGDKWSFDTTTTMDEKGQVLANGQLAQPIDQTFTQRRVGSVEITGLENGLPSAMHITFDRESSNTAGAGGQQPPPFPLAGKAVNVSRKDGILTTDLGKEIDTPTIQEVGHMLDVDTSVYPKEPVAINQEWDGDTTAMAKAYQLAPNDKVAIKCKLTDVHSVNGRDVAEVSLNGTMVKHEQGFIEATTALTGTCRIDLATGEATDLKVDGKMTMTGATQQAAPDGTQVKITITANGDIKVRQTITLADVKPAVGDGGFIPKPALLPGPVKSPLDIGSDKDAGPFSGSFNGDHVGLQLTDTAGQVSGTLTVGEKKYPLTGKSDGKKLAGSFASDGTKFDFTATLDGSTLTLTSEGNTYTLKKPANNPLAKPQPKNPLAE